MVRKAGDAIGALAIVVVDNPMCPGTGHRICNDCMKACIYQKQEPVNIPQIETGVLTDVLRLPWGVEIYGLLTRWNPLNVRRPYALPYNGRNVLVVGLGPAGYTLAHYLLNEGFGVVAIDGLKIEPLPATLTGDATAQRAAADRAAGTRSTARLDERVLEGFGGVSEYGITVRWDKNFLTLLHLTLARRDRLRIYGGVRFGGTLPIEDAWAHGFDHIAIAAGAGQADRHRHEEQPGARHPQGQRLPDGAAAHRRLQARRAAEPAGAAAGRRHRRRPDRHRHRHRAVRLLPGAGGEDARALRSAGAPSRARPRSARCATPRSWRSSTSSSRTAARCAPSAQRAAAAGEAPDFVPLVRGWGGVTLAYRKRMTDSPAYRLNHEEVVKALEEGIWFVENLDPREIVADEHDHVAGAASSTGPTGAGASCRRARCWWRPARRPTSPTRRSSRGTFQLDAKQRFFQGFRAERANGARDAGAGPGRLLHLVQRRRAG